MSERNYLRDDVREALEEILADRTPVSSISTESVRALARDEAVSVGNAAQRECEETGLICHVRKDIEAMRTAIGALQMEQTKLFAVLGFWKWALPIGVPIAIFLAGFLAPRLFPVPQPHMHDSNMQHVQAVAK
jgi:hypothetical protein